MTAAGWRIDTGAAIDRGPRDDQQDNVLTGERFAAIADGVGSRADSDVAAAVAVDTYADIARVVGSGGEAAGNAATDLVDALLDLPRKVAERLGQLGSQGLTTAAAAIVDGGNRLWLTHIGDSQVVLVRRGHPLYVSRPHTLLADAEQVGQAEAVVDRERAERTVSRSLGATRAGVVPFVAVCRIEAEDQVILTTDGVHGVLPIDTIIAMATRRTSAAYLAESILDAARSVGLVDNATCAVLRTVAPQAVTAW